VDDTLKEIAQARRQLIRSTEPGGAGIDLEIDFKSAYDVLVYLPRALQIGFLAPFPDFWFSQGPRQVGSAMRAASALEMVFVYAALLGLPILVWRRRRQPVLWLLLFVCAGMLVVYALSVPNVGALYRFRYPFLMPLVCMGVAGWLSLRSGAAEQAQVGTRQ
jgi:hypothetical protein